MLYQERNFGQLRMFILDVLRHDDIENLTSILKLLNNRGCIGWREFWPEDFSPDEVSSELQRLANDGQVQVLREIGQGDQLEPVKPDRISAIYEHLWFTLTDTGRHAWDEWEPPVVP